MLPIYEGTGRVKQSVIDYQNLVRAYTQKYGNPKVEYDRLVDITNTFYVENVEIRIEYTNYSKMTSALPMRCLFKLTT